MPHNSPHSIDQQAAFFKTLGNSRRLLILSILSKGQLSVNEIATMAGSTLQNVSQHLTILKRAGILKTERNGHTILYKIADSERMSKVLGTSDKLNFEESFNHNDKEKK